MNIKILSLYNVKHTTLKEWLALQTFKDPPGHSTRLYINVQENFLISYFNIYSYSTEVIDKLFQAECPENIFLGIIDHQAYVTTVV